MAPERRDRPDHRAEVAGVGDVIQRHDQPRVLRRCGAIDQVLDLRVLVRRDLQANPLVQSVAGHLVEFRAVDFQHRDATIGAGVDGFRQACVITRAVGDEQRCRRHPRVEALNDGVAPNNELVFGADTT